MKTDQIVMCIVALFLGMLLANMLKNVCGCQVVEGSAAEILAARAARYRADHPDGDGAGMAQAKRQKVAADQQACRDRADKIDALKASGELVDTGLCQSNGRFLKKTNPDLCPCNTLSDVKGRCNKRRDCSWVDHVEHDIAMHGERIAKAHGTVEHQAKHKRFQKRAAGGQWANEVCKPKDDLSGGMLRTANAVCGSSHMTAENCLKGPAAAFCQPA